MPKAAAPPPKKTPTPKKAPPKKRKSDPVEDDPALFYSDDEDYQQEVIIVYGEIGSGKTYFANSASVFWPRKLPAPKMTTLADTFTFQCDRKAGAGLKGDNVRGPIFDPIAFRARPDMWGEFFKTQPDWVQTISVGVRKLYDHVDRCIDAGLRPICILDSLTTFDSEQLRRAKAEQRRLEAEGVKHNAYGHFGIHGEWHTDFMSDVMGSGADIILCCHQRDVQTATRGAKDRGIVVRVAGNLAEFEPDLQGKVGPKMYKRHSTLQVLIQAHRVKVAGKNELRRTAYYGVNDTGGEMKNRYERALAPLNGQQSPPDLGRVLEMVRA